MRIKLPNQTNGDIRVTDFNGEHVFPVAGDGTIDVPDETLATHVLVSVDGAVAVEAGDHSAPEASNVHEVEIPSDLIEQE